MTVWLSLRGAEGPEAILAIARGEIASAAVQPRNDGVGASQPRNDGVGVSQPRNDGVGVSQPRNDRGGVLRSLAMTGGCHCEGEEAGPPWLSLRGGGSGAALVVIARGRKRGRLGCHCEGPKAPKQSLRDVSPGTKKNGPTGGGTDEEIASATSWPCNDGVVDFAASQ